MRKIRIGQIGIGHNHASEKMAALRRLSDLYEVVGVVEPDEKWWKERGNLAAYQGIPRLTEEELFRTENLEAVAVETDGFELLETASITIFPYTWTSPAARNWNRSARF